MTYSLVSETTESYGPTIGGLSALHDAVLPIIAEAPDQWVALHQLIDHGQTDNPQLLVKEINRILPRISFEPVKETLLHIAEVASKSRECLAICA